MAFDRITDGDLLGKGNLGRPDTPGVDTAEMQRILDELPREVIVPAFNRLADQLEASDAAASLGAVPPESLPEDTPATVQGVLEAALNKNDEHTGRTDNPHAVTAAQTGAYTKEETDAAISQRVTEIGAGDMAQAVYDPTGQKKDVFAAIGEAVAGAGHMEKSVYAAAGEPGAVDRALSADKALAADDGVKVYTHSKSGTVHEFTGTGANGRAKMTADVQAGDTFTVNGAPVAAYVGADSAADAMAGSPWNGRWVSFTVEGGTLNFKGGGGKVTVTGLAAAAIKQGNTVTVKQGEKVVASVAGTYFGSNIVYFGFGYARGGSTSYSTARAWFSECFIGSGNYAVCQKAGTYTLYLGGGGSSARRYTLYVNDSAIPYDGFGAYQHLWAVPRQLNAGDTLYVTGYHPEADSSAVLVIAKA